MPSPVLAPWKVLICKYCDIYHDASPHYSFSFLPTSLLSLLWPQEISECTMLPLTVLPLPVLPALLQVAFTAEVNCGHHDEVCQHCDTPGLLQEAERNMKWQLSACQPDTTAAGFFLAKIFPLLSRAWKRHWSCEPAPAGHRDM